MKQIESRWSKNLKDYRIVSKLDDRNIEYFIIEMKRGFWIFENWIEIGPDCKSIESAINWINHQCYYNTGIYNTHIVWDGKYPNRNIIKIPTNNIKLEEII
jgi:hypothetical protein